jgi:hypothetical protein
MQPVAGLDRRTIAGFVVVIKTTAPSVKRAEKNG